MYDTANVGVSIIIENENNEVLLGLRKSNLGDNTWGFPGGKLEKGESIENCIKRELKEETDLDLIDCHFYGITNDIFEDGNHFITIYMIADEVSGQVKIMEPDKVEEWKLFDMKKLPDNLFLPVKNLVNENNFYSL